jgi:uncharacterized protein
MQAGAAAAPSDLVTKQFKRWLTLIAGWGFVALGVVGLFLPFLQGVLLLLVGLSILSSEYVWAHKLLQQVRERFPSLSSRLEAAKRRARAWLRRIIPPGSGDTRD